MSGSRCKAIRRAFIAKHGRSPLKAVTSSRDAAVQNPKTGKWTKVVLWMGGIIGLREMRVDQPSEWRAAKRAWRAA